MRSKEIKSFIRKACEDPSNTPPAYIWGQPGIGKSSVIREVAEELKIGFIDTRPAQHDASDYRGIPAVVDGEARWLASSELPFKSNKRVREKGLLIADELSSAPPLIQATLYQPFLDRKLGEEEIRDGWYMIAAGNRIEDRAVVYRMSTALANRFIHIDYEVNIDDWTKWALDSNIDSNVIAFIKWKPELLAPKFDPNSSEKAFATPRTWEFASTIVEMHLGVMTHELLEGTIGKGAAAEFMAFLKIQTRLPDLDDILIRNKNIVPKEVDLKYALVAALATRAKGPQQYERLLQYSEELPEEFNVLMVKLMIAKDEQSLMLCPSRNEWAKKHADVLIARS